MALSEKIVLPRMEIHLQDKQEFYNNGDTIRGKIVLLDVDVAAKPRIDYLRVKIILEECIDIAPAGMQKSTWITKMADRVDVREEFENKASLHEYAFEVIVPLAKRFPSVCLDHVGARNCGLIWRVCAELGWRHCETLSILETFTNVTVYPIIFHEKPCKFHDGTIVWKDLDVCVKVPKILPQGPTPCDITVVLKPKKPLPIEKVQVFLKKRIIMCCDEAARVLAEDIMFETIQVGKTCSSDIQFNGIRRGWQLERPLNPDFNLPNMVCTYNVWVSIWAPHVMTTQSAPVLVCSPVSKFVDAQPPSYSSSLCMKAAQAAQGF